MSEIERRFHETWLGLVQPSQGLVVSIPVLVDRQCMVRSGPELQQRLRGICPEDQDGRPRLTDLGRLFAEVLELAPERFDRGDALPRALSLHVPEGKQTLRPTMALRRLDAPAETAADADADSGDADLTPAAAAGKRYHALVWDLAEDGGDGLDLDRAEHQTGPWDYPPAAKFERLLRHCRVPIGLLTNRHELRLIYAPHGESSGWIAFRFADLIATGGRPIVDALVMLLGEVRWFAVAEERALPALLAESRRRQAEVTNTLAEQVYEALELLLAGFEAASARDGDDLLRAAADAGDDYLYRGLLTVLLRLVFTLFAEDRGLLPIDHPLYAEHTSVVGLFDRLQADAAAHPDAMSRRFGAWSRLVAGWRAIYLGVAHGDLRIPPRHGHFFDPSVYGFLEGWGLGGSSPIGRAADEQRAAVRVPSIDDRTVYAVLTRLLFLDRQRLSYSALDVEQIGSVYEALMGYHVVRLAAPSVCLRPQRAAKVWVSARELLAVKRAQREAFLKDTIGLQKAHAGKIARAIEGVKDEDEALGILAELRVRGTEVAVAGRLVVQPGEERRRTSSHYTPRSLTEPIAKRTLEPLLAAMGPEPSSEALLSLKICDPAMGSGAFLVAVVRALADQVVAAWTREGDLARVASVHEDVVNHARRLVAQRCVYGVDKNPIAVNLAKLSLWLVTLARELPFTFVDHALRCGDSLVGLSLDELRAFHWDPGARQQELVSQEIEVALQEAVGLRQRICDLAAAEDAVAVRERERLLRDADDATGRLRLIGDLIVGAFFEGEKAKDREKERVRRLELVGEWLRGGGAVPVELGVLQARIRERVLPFHWHVEMPEVFYGGRGDPLEGGKVNSAALMDGFVGNPPFMGGKRIPAAIGSEYADFLEMRHQGSRNADLCIHFFRRAASLLGAHGVIAFVATNTVFQGDSRRTGLQSLLIDGRMTITAATSSMLWPGTAAVAVSIVHLAHGTPAHRFGMPLLDGRRVTVINSRLRATPERPDPQRLLVNGSLCYQGVIPLPTEGFTLTPSERERLVRQSARNAEVIRPFLGGEEFNTSPSQTFSRYIIDFRDHTLDEISARWPALIDIVRERAYDARMKQNREAYKKRWWQFAERRTSLSDGLRLIQRCLATAQTSSHLCINIQPTDRVFSTKAIIFLMTSFSPLSVLQSRPFERWTSLVSSTMKEDLSFTSEAFETFPFPTPDPRAVLPDLETLGERLYTARAAFMIETDQGLTKTYNALKDPAVDDPRVAELRRLHEELDRAVLHAYGWDDIPVPPYWAPQTPAERRAFEAFEDEVIDRLFELNARRAAEEARDLGRAQGKGGGAKRPKGGGNQTTLAGTEE